ncbi:MAG: AMP-binding protein [Sphaerochaetaceae bacterium]|nr:AMP-binding protein [Sphaerochaetaceae bacterium]
MRAKFNTASENIKNTFLKDGPHTSIKNCLERLLKYYPDKLILGELDEERKNLVHWDGKQVFWEIQNLGDGLIAYGFKGSHIAVISENSCRYVLADTCISSGVGVVIPLDKDASEDLTATLLNRCDADVVMCTKALLKKVEAVKPHCPLLKTVILMDKKVDGYLFWDEIVAKGKEVPQDANCYRNKEMDMNAPAKIIFTSGTTGANKGVVLTNTNLTVNMQNCLDTIRTKFYNNISMSVLPMHHSTEINTHVIARIGSGELTYVCHSLRNIMADMKVYKPHLITVVPMVANAFYKGIWDAAEKQGKADKLRMGIKINRLFRLFGIDKSHEIFKEVFEPFGGNLNQIICGGSGLNPDVVKGFNDLGVLLCNGYGITECGPLVSLNSETLHDYRSVGRPCPQSEVKIYNPDEDGVGEICVRGKSVFSGYYKDEENTRKVMDSDGFFHTGDNGYLDEKGRIVFSGRIKNTIVLSNGKNVAPEEIEELLAIRLTYATDIVVFPSTFKQGKISQETIVAGIYIADEGIRKDTKRVSEDVRMVNATLPAYKKVNFVMLADCEYPKTSTRKIKRTGLPETVDTSVGFTV